MKRTETDLYRPIKLFFENRGYEVKGEVMHCDLVAIHPEEKIPILIELKVNMNLSLILQAITRLKVSDHVYVAVEHRPRSTVNAKRSQIIELCKRLGIGLLTVHFYKTKEPRVDVICEPLIVLPKQNKRRALRLLTEFQQRTGDYNVGGSTRQKIMTAYRELAIHCAEAIKNNDPPQLSPKQLGELTGSKKVGNVLRDNHYGWFERVERGIYTITEKGEEELGNFVNQRDSQQ